TVEEPVDGVRAGVTLPYSPEFSELRPNRELLEQLKDLTDGKMYYETELAKVIADDEVFRPSPNKERSRLPLWYWLVVLTGLGMFVDVALRRVAVGPGGAEKEAANPSLRGRGPSVPGARP